MYEEDSWEAPAQQPAAETEDGQGAVVPAAPSVNAELQVPARAQEKPKGGLRFFKRGSAAASKNTEDDDNALAGSDTLAGGNAGADEGAKTTPRKKGIPKWQYGVLGGFVVVAGGGFAVITLIHPMLRLSIRQCLEPLNRRKRILGP